MGYYLDQSAVKDNDTTIAVKFDIIHLRIEDVCIPHVSFWCDWCHHGSVLFIGENAEVFGNQWKCHGPELISRYIWG